MLTNSRDIKQRLEKDGWVGARVSGSHHVFKHLNWTPILGRVG
jgi:predicted RNA binding protein YcfA (HicA-like mRNA interferase family)